MRSCLECHKFNFQEGSPDYSEWTGGWDPTISCDATPSHWTIDMDHESQEGFCSKLLQAETCKDFVPITTVNAKRSSCL